MTRGFFRRLQGVILVGKVYGVDLSGSSKYSCEKHED